MKLHTTDITSDAARIVLQSMSRRCDVIEGEPQAQIGLYINNIEANILQKDLNRLPGRPVITDCSYRGHPVRVL